MTVYTIKVESKIFTFAPWVVQELIRSMLEVEVGQRYSALQVLEHPWVTVSLFQFLLFSSGAVICLM